MSKNVERVLIYIESMNTNEEGGSRTRLKRLSIIYRVSVVFFIYCFLSLHGLYCPLVFCMLGENHY